MVPMLVVDGQIVGAVEKHPRVDEAVDERFAGELPVPLTSCDAFREHEVVRLEAQRDDPLP